MPSASTMSSRSPTAYAGSTMTASPVARSPMRYTKFTIWRAIWSPRAKSRPDRSWRKYNRWSSTVSLIVVLHFAGQCIQTRHELLHLGACVPESAIEFVDQGGCPFQARHQHVHVNFALFEELHDGVQFPTGVGVAQLLHRDWLICYCGHDISSFFPSTRSFRISVDSTRDNADPSAKRVTTSLPTARPAAFLTSSPDTVRVNEYPRSNWRSTSYAVSKRRHDRALSASRARWPEAKGPRRAAWVRAAF